MGHVRHNSEEWRPTPTERRIQSLACRRAMRQLLRVSPGRFRRAVREYLEWEAFSLWIRAIIDSSRRPPACVMEALQKRCPGFLPNEQAASKLRQGDSDPLPLRFLGWVHNNIFAKAKREGWLDALIFYSVRDPRSQQMWAYWEHCEREWKRKRPRSYPSFERWLHAAKTWRRPGRGATGGRTGRLT